MAFSDTTLAKASEDISYLVCHDCIKLSYMAHLADGKSCIDLKDNFTSNKVKNASKSKFLFLGHGIFQFDQASLFIEEKSFTRHAWMSWCPFHFPLYDWLLVILKEPSQIV